MELENIKRLVQSSESSTSATREEASDMLVFGRINQWDDEIGDGVQLQYRGAFDIVKPRRNRIVAELWANPISVDFKPKDGAKDDAAEIINGMFRTDMIRSEEAHETAVQDQVDCGFGAFRLCTQYESQHDDLNNNQRIQAEPINEANNVVYLDNNARRKDKSDMRWALIITSFTTEGWKSYCEENGINYEDNKTPESFKAPNTTDSMIWRSKEKEIKVGEFYHRKKKRQRVFIYEDPLGNHKAYLHKEIKNVIDDLDAAGFTKVDEKYRDHWEVTKYLVTGSKVIKKQRVPGEYIPIIPVFGDWSFVEGREIWRGIYHDAQDPQRLHNFLMSYLADVVAKGPRQKPIFYPEQIQGHEFMYLENGADDNRPYATQNRKDANGVELPPGPIGYLEPPQMPQALGALMGLTRQSVDDVTGGASDSADMLNSQVTEGQIRAMQSAQNMEAFLYQNNYALAMKQCGRVYASMASELYDVPREVTITKEDGTEETAMIMEAVFDYDTGEEVILNDLTTGTFEVYASPGPNYQSQREAAQAEMKELATALQGTAEGQMALLTYLTMLDGPMTKPMREYARKQLVINQMVEPDNEEEMAWLQEAMQAKQSQPDPNMELAKAEQVKAQADMLDAQNKQAKVQVDAFNAETKRAEAETDRAETLASIGKTQAETAKIGREMVGTELDNMQKGMDSVQRIYQRISPAPNRIQ